MSRARRGGDPFPDYGSLSSGISIGALALGSIFGRILGLEQSRPIARRAGEMEHMFPAAREGTAHTREREK
jgi:hypothetical protein